MRGIDIPLMYLSDIINENKRIELRKVQNVKLRNELRFKTVNNP